MMRFNRYRLKNRIRQVFKDRRIDAGMTGALFVLLGMIAFFAGLHWFWMGFHNFDGAQNYINMQDQINLELCERGLNMTVSSVETTLAGGKIEYNDLYLMGLKQVIYSIQFIFVGSLFAGIGLGILTTRYKNGK